jgi:formylglycine-generating enzyme required for sulfatase activity
LIGGVVVGLAVFGGVAFMMMNKSGETALVADAAPAAIEEPATPDVSAPDETATDQLAGIASDVSSVDGAALSPDAEIVAEAPVEAPAAVEEKASGPFRDCESCPLMMPLPGGAFTMGSPSSEAGHNAYEGPQREVSIKPFAIGVYELTEAEWKLCVSDNACKSKPSSGDDGAMPALYLSWRDATDYAAWLSKKADRKYRLPTEAEWEYAARGGTTSAYWWGESFDRARVSTSSAGAVGTFGANGFGLYDVASNAREWVADCYVNNFVKAPVDGSAVTEGDCGKRVIRGGAWLSAPTDMRVANRSRIDSGVRARYMGVRLAAEIE